MQLLKVDASAAENEVFGALARITFRTIDRNRGDACKGVLFRTTLLKSFLSSPDACRATVDARLKQSALSDDADEAVRHDRRVLADLRSRVIAVTLAEFAKFRGLVEELTRVGVVGPNAKERVVIFSERIHTLKMLESELPKALDLSPAAMALFHGTLDDVKQQALVRAFGEEKATVRILLASDAASEGINLHYHCHRVIHFDIPWSLIRLEQRNGRIDRYGQTKVPELRYLLTIPKDPGLKGDLRILERLIEREAMAQRNIGDVAWLMKLHDVDKEEQRVGQAIESHESPDLLFPDGAAAPQDFLSLLLDGAAASPSAEPDAVSTVDALSLYASDADYARAAFDEIGASTAGFVPPEWSVDGRSLILVPPQDLAARLAYLPLEVRPKNGELKLTVDRARVQASLEKAREEGSWPEWQLLWAIHPVAEWLGDCVLGSFTRHEAPVVRVGRGLNGLRACFVLQGVLSNQLSQPILVDWFGVMFGKGEIVPIRELVARTGLGEPLVNDRRPIDLSPLIRLLPEAVERAREHMRARRTVRSAELFGELQTELRRLKRWHEGVSDAIDNKRQKILESRPTLRGDEELFLKKGRDEADKQRDARTDWIQRRLRTVESPFLRIAAVLIPRDVRS